MENKNLQNMDTNLQAEINSRHFANGFWQPLLESVTNSFQAKAQNIDIYFALSNQQDILRRSTIESFCVCDDGDGFTAKNIERFNVLRSHIKLDGKDGCKGIGRISYLKVFEEVKFTSFAKEENKKIEFAFNKNFQSISNANDDKNVIDCNVNDIKYHNKPYNTIANFSNCSEVYYKVSKNKKVTDKRGIYDKDYIINLIKEHLLVMLFLSKGRIFNIRLYCDNFNDADAIITQSDIPDFKNKNFIVKDENDEEYNFNLYHHVNESAISNTVGLYCANRREVCQFERHGVNIGVENKSITFLLCSDFFDRDDIVKSERDDFYITQTRTTPEIPLSWNDINTQLKQTINIIIQEECFDSKEENYKKAIQKRREEIIKRRPYLAPYLKNDTIGLMNVDNAIKDAHKELNKERDGCLDEIDDKTFLTEPSVRERVQKAIPTTLAEYMYLRKSVVEYLDKLVQDKSKNEAEIHNLILPKGSKHINDDVLLIEDVYKNNLWLLDDRFMSYRYAFSDKKIKEIKEMVEDGMHSKEPDLAVLFNDIMNDSNDIRGVAIELKPFNNKLEDNEKGMNQLTRNRMAFFKSDKIKEKYYYLITSIDKQFEELLTAEDGFGYVKILSSNGVIFRDKAFGNTFVMPIETLINECKARHNLFFKILEDCYIKPSSITDQTHSF